MKIRLIIMLLALPCICQAGSYRDINTRLEKTGATPAIHALACGTAAHYLVVEKDLPPWKAFIIPVAIGLAKEFTDKNFGEDDMIANVAGSFTGAWITPNIEIGRQDDGFYVKWTKRF
ncbi:MAG: hypothetical protein GY800_09075 [Planctomycetes bacterium]|nr:hypothetical protein [Planctomycetota bacterium]